MKTMIFSMLIIAMISCGDSDPNCDIEYGTPFNIEVGGIYCHPNGQDLEILEFSTSYCPCFSNCIWQGELQVVARLSGGNETDTSISIHEFRSENNSPGFSISGVSITRDCEPQVVSVQITLDPS